MKKFLFSILGCIAYPFILINAQIGINLDYVSPDYVMQIHPKEIVSTDSSKDIFITKEGKVGLATKTPTADLSINGSLRINDGTQANNYVLTSMNSEGVSFWTTDSLSSVIRNATLKMKTRTFSASYNVTYNMVAFLESNTFSNNIEDASFDASTATLHLPSGYYFLSLAPPLELSGTNDFFFIRTYINNALFLESSGFTIGIGFTTFYHSNVDFDISFEYFWKRPTNSPTSEIRSYNPSLTMIFNAQQISL